MLWKCCTQHVSKFGKLSSGHGTGKGGQFSFQSQRRKMQKNVQITVFVLISHASKVMLKIFQARLQQYVNWELPDVKVGFQRSRGTRGRISNIIGFQHHKARGFEKNIYFCLIDYTKSSDCVDYNKLWEILKEAGIPDHLLCLLRNLNASQEATVRT